jgi:molybdopterin converting factor small subunit
MLASFCDGQREFKLEAATVGEALEAAMAAHPMLRTHLFDEGREVRRNVSIFLNDEEVRHLPGGDAALKAGDEVVVLQAMSGG